MKLLENLFKNSNMLSYRKPTTVLISFIKFNKHVQCHTESEDPVIEQCSGAVTDWMKWLYGKDLVRRSGSPVLHIVYKITNRAKALQTTTYS